MLTTRYAGLYQINEQRRQTLKIQKSNPMEVVDDTCDSLLLISFGSIFIPSKKYNTILSIIQIYKQKMSEKSRHKEIFSTKICKNLYFLYLFKDL